MIDIFEDWLHHDVGTVFIQLFEAALASWCHLPASICIYQELCGSSLILEHNGDLYSCDHFVEPDFYLGNIHTTPLSELVGQKKQRRFGQAKESSLPKQCRECEVRFMCNGGCPKNRFARTREGEPGLNYLCEGYRYFFNHCRPFADALAALLKVNS